jgi:hypothetical protein
MSTSLETLYPLPPFLDQEAPNLFLWKIDIQVDGTVFTFSPQDLVSAPVFSLENNLHLSKEIYREFKGKIQLEISPESTLWESFFYQTNNKNQTFEASLSITSPQGDSLTVASGVLVQIAQENGIATLTITLSLPNGEKLLCRDASLLDGHSSLEPETWLPQIFGQGDLYPTPLFQTFSVRLKEELLDSHTIIQLETPVDWPNQGTVQINDELIVYQRIGGFKDQLGTEEDPLNRPSPKHHRRYSRVVLLPSSGLRWCAADHEADVLFLRVENEEGNAPESYIISQESLGGRLATLIRSDRLPLKISTARYSIEYHSIRTRESWNLLYETTAFDPYDAFIKPLPFQGSRLLRDHPLLSASYQGEESTDHHRFDQLSRLTLIFQFGENPGWEPFTRLKVTARKSGQTIERKYDRRARIDSYTQQVPQETTALIESTPPVQKERAYFEILETDGIWTNSERMINCSFQQSATLTPGLPGKITGMFTTSRPESERQISQISLLAHLTNTAQTTQSIKLTILLPGKLEKHNTISIGTTFEGTLELALDLPTNVTALDLFANNAQYIITFSDGLAVQVQEVYLEYHHKLPVNTQLVLQSPTNAEKSIYGGPTYHEVEIDLTPLITADNRQDFLYSTDDPLTLGFELLNPLDDPLWDVEIRAVVLLIETYPCSSVYATDKLWAQVRGRTIAGRTNANPSDVIHALLSEDRFGAVPSTHLQESSFESAYTTTEQRNLAFCAVFQEKLTLARVIGQALAESTTNLLFYQNKYHLIPLPLELESILCPQIPPQHREAVLPERNVTFTNHQHTSPLTLKSHDNTTLYQSPNSLGDSFKLRWLVQGAEALSRYLANRLHPKEHTLTLSITPSWLSLPIGIPLSFIESLYTNASWQGELSKLTFAQGRLLSTISFLRPVQSVSSDSLITLQRNDLEGWWLFLYDGQSLARFTDQGDLYITGELQENTLDQASSLQAISAHTSPPGILLFHKSNTDVSTAILLEQSGNAQTLGIIKENTAIFTPTSQDVVEWQENQTIIAGHQNQNAAVSLSNGQIILSGSIVTHFPL